MFKTLFLSLLLTSTQVFGAYVPEQGSGWTTLTPSTTLGSLKTDYSGTFGIAIVMVSPTVSASATNGGAASIASATYSGAGSITSAPSVTTISIQQRKRDYVSTILVPISQIGDGQIQGTTQTLVTTIKQSSGVEIQPTLTTTQSNTQTITTTQISTSTTSASACDVCSTGHTVFTLSDSSSETPAPSSSCNSISTFTTVEAGTTYVVQSSLSSCNAPESTNVPILDDVTTITSTSTTIASGTTSANATSSTASATSSSSFDYIGQQSCKKNGTLTMTLHKSLLIDSSNRIGSIVANHQFQFDGPSPQSGAIYAAGWGITTQGTLAIGNTTVFYQCLSGTFYNLYDENVGQQCSPVYLSVVELIDC